MKTFILIIITLAGCLLIASCCKKLFPDEELTLQRQDYIGNELRTEGYYYSHFETGVTAVLFLYKNGVTLSAGGYLTFDLSEIEKRLSNIKTQKVDWGVFVVNEDTIRWEKWIGTLRPNASTITYIGYVENDTTIRFRETYYKETNETGSIDETWHFKQFDHKPDSTNDYIQ
ncbi:MAG: hypothetical protein LBU91_07505 [Bacteroidales bacterium]|jgi:hypothetical protein|nr:hypothetical protein [Bacteroidales bacterium]